MERILAKSKDFISTQDLSKEALDEILALSQDIKEHPAKYHDSLKGKSLCLFFFNPSTRTRNSIEVGISQMGGYAVYNDPKYSWWGQNSESIKDTAIVLGRYHAAVGIRMFPNRVDWQKNHANKLIREFAEHCPNSVINLEDDCFHPCQAICDMFTIQEKKPDYKKKKIVVSWAYHPKPLPLSVPNSITQISTRYGMDVTLACPPGFELEDPILNVAKENAKKSQGSFRVSHDLEDAYEDADVVYVKSWGAPKEYGNPRAEKKMRLPYRDDWCIGEKHLNWTKEDSILMHCLPVRRNIVATDAALDGPHSVIYDQAENRLYTLKALLHYLLKNPFVNEPTFYE